MATQCRIPELGENVKTAVVVKVLVSKGDQVARDQPVAELETDKAVVEIPSGVEGTVESVLVQVGDEVHVGQALFTVGAAGEAASGPAGAAR